MADIVDLDKYRERKSRNGNRKPRRRRTPGGRGFADMSHYLSTAVPDISDTPEEGDGNRTDGDD